MIWDIPVPGKRISSVHPLTLDVNAGDRIHESLF
jgi:hypothetical protein